MTKKRKTAWWYHMCACTYLWWEMKAKRNETKWEKFYELTFLLTILNESNCKRAKYNCFSFCSSYKYNAMRCDAMPMWFSWMISFSFRNLHFAHTCFLPRISWNFFLHSERASDPQYNVFHHINILVILRWTVPAKTCLFIKCAYTFNPTYCTLLSVVGVNIMQSPIFSLIDFSVCSSILYFYYHYY